VQQVVITYFKAPSSNLSEGAKENHEKLHLGQLIIWTRFRQSTSQIQVYTNLPGGGVHLKNYTAAGTDKRQC
jgi:hypothetical protein